MKTFLGRVLAVVVGLSIFIYLIFLFFTVLGSFLSDEESVKINEKSILRISLNQEILESPYEANSILLSFKENDDTYFYKALKEIENAKTDENIEGVFLDFDLPSSVSLSKTNEIRKALMSFKESGKFIYAYTNRASQNDYYLATVADSIFHHPMGLIELKGLGSEVTFYKDLSEKYGIEFEIIRHGKYKSAIEPFVRNDLSDENRYQMKLLLDDFWNSFTKRVSNSRDIDISSINDASNNLAGFNAKELLDRSLVDVLAQKDEVIDFLRRKVNVDSDNLSFTNKKFVDWLDYTASQQDKYSKNKIAILYAGGNIIPGDGQVGIQSEAYLQAIKEIQNKKNIKAVILRVNSGGGDAVTSDEILYQLKKLKSEKPIVVSFGDVAASGGYYISQASDRIFAEDYTITGSIGVFGMIPNFKGLANSVGINSDTVTTNANSIYYSPLHGLTPFAKEKLSESIENTYQRFISIVAEGRDMPILKIDSLGGGRVYTANQALKANLIDEIGGINEAIDYASNLSQLDKYEIVHYPKAPDSFESLMKELNLSTEISKQIVGEENTELLNEFIQINNLRKINGTQMWWPYKFEL